MSQISHDLTSTKPPAWNPSNSANFLSIADEEDVDEPPDLQATTQSPMFERKSIYRIGGANTSLLTEAIQGKPEAKAEEHEIHHHIPLMFTPSSSRRRSMASNFSLASTAELTSDTSPTSRASTPSPPQPELGLLQITDDHFNKLQATPRPINGGSTAPKPTTAPASAASEEAPKKRCISFACANGPTTAAKPLPRPAPMVKTTSADAPPRKTCIRFACPPRAASTQNTPQDQMLDSKLLLLSPASTVSSATPKALRTGRCGQLTSSPRPSLPLQSPARKASKAGPPRPRYRATSTDLKTDASRFYGFASDEPREEDWIRNEKASTRTRLTIKDTLTKENTIRQLAKEAEDEEEEAGRENDDDDDDDDDDAEPDEDVEGEDDAEDQEMVNELEEIDEDDDGYASDSSRSDGYHSDEETGFADSDLDEVEEAVPVVAAAFTIRSPIGHSLAIVNASKAPRRQQYADNNKVSDGSTGPSSYKTTVVRVKPRRIRSRPATPELPDSTDFVCGTLDEDRPLEEAYMSCIEARKRQKLQIIPQDIDPSFPASEPEDDDDDDNEDEKGARAANDSDEHVWLHGEMEDLDNDQDRSRRKKRDVYSPRRLRSPPPQQHKLRARSPRPAVGRTTPRRQRSPAPQLMTLLSPRPGAAAAIATIGFDLNRTNSLPKPLGMFNQLRRRMHARPATQGHNMHVRGAIDIVKGLEHKRTRRREKFLSKYCDRARKGQIPERKPLPGTGAEKMKELGLMMAGKREGRFVISV